MPISKIKLVSVAAVLATALAAVAGCSSGGGAESSDGKPQIVVTTAFLADIVRPIAGDDADIVQLIPNGATPHSYSASAKDRATLEQADGLIAIGAGYEAGLPLDDSMAKRINVAELVGGAGSRPIDPHVWTDPSLMVRAAPIIARFLGDVDRAHAAAYNRRAGAEADALRKLDARIAKVLAVVPEPRRQLITSHDALSRFAAHYDFEVLATPFGLAPEAEASAARVAKVVQAAKSSDIPAVFSQKGDNPAVMRRIASEANVKVVDDLLVEGPGPGGRDYSSAMLHNARSIAGALR